jgi:hypothetical protein
LALVLLASTAPRWFSVQLRYPTDQVRQDFGVLAFDRGSLHSYTPIGWFLEATIVLLVVVVLLATMSGDVVVDRAKGAADSVIAPIWRGSRIGWRSQMGVFDRVRRRRPAASYIVSGSSDKTLRIRSKGPPRERHRMLPGRRYALTSEPRRPVRNRHLARGSSVPRT